MFWKLLVITFVIFVFLEKKQNSLSEPVLTRVQAMPSLDTAGILTQYCHYFDKVRLTLPNGRVIRLHWVKVVTAQFVLETNYGTSPVYKENHNMFGMKCNKRGFTVCEKNGHAAYARVSDSVRDYMMYQDMMLRLAQQQGRYPHNEEEYMALLEDLPHLRGHRYATDPDYIKKLRLHLGLLRAMG